MFGPLGAARLPQRMKHVVETFEHWIHGWIVMFIFGTASNASCEQRMSLTRVIFDICFLWVRVLCIP